MKILPPTLWVITIAVMAGLRLILPGPSLIPAPFHWLGLVLMIIGLALALAGSRQFSRVGTTINTFDEPVHLVTDGLFRWSRNPMYLGFALGLMGLAVLLQTLAGFVLSILFIAVTDRWYIRFEEAALRRHFGAAYDHYTHQTRRWL